MIINDLDLGSYNPFKTTTRTFHTGLVPITGGYALPFGDHTDPDEWKARIWIKAPAAVGQYGAGTQAACEFLSRQLEEMVRNPDIQPLYLQFYAGTGTVALPQNFGQPQDGWYFITQLTVDYTRSLFGYTVADFSVQFVSPGPPRRVGITTRGGALSSTYSGASNNWIAFATNASPFTTGIAGFTRTGSEGGLTVDLGNPLGSNPVGFIPSATVSDWFKAGCHVYDAMAGIGTNAVPAPPTALNANWIEVKGIDHRFVGDVVITNGLLLAGFTVGASPGIFFDLWNTALGTAGWQQFALLNGQDNVGNLKALKQISLLRVGAEEIAVQLMSATSNGSTFKTTIRLQRGAYTARLDFSPVTADNTNSSAFYLTHPANPKILYNSGVGAATAIADNGLAGQANPVPTTDYGYGAAFRNDNTYPFITGWLYQNPPHAAQPQYNNDLDVSLGDDNVPAQNATRSYGIFAVPFPNPQNMQAEAESGTLGTGWSSQANANASGGNEAKCASGTLTGNADTFGTSFLWPTTYPFYDVWFRVKVTSAAGNTSEMQLGMWNVDTAAFSVSTTYKANQVTTSYAWYRVYQTWNPNSFANHFRFKANTTATLGTDWFVDEACIVPTAASANAGLNMPQDLWQQFIYDRTTKQILG